jgi:hypothetical protein
MFNRGKRGKRGRCRFIEVSAIPSAKFCVFREFRGSK